jgi:hypothetical protein
MMDSEKQFNETQSSIPLELNDLNCCENCYQRLNVSDYETPMLLESQQGWPRPGSTQEDQRPCQSDFPVKATGASPGKTMPLRILSMSKSSKVTEIWEEAERRLGSSRYNFSLIYSGHEPLPADGTLDQPQQLFEIRWKGRGGMDDVDFDDDHYWNQDEDQDAYSDEDEDDDVCGKQIRCHF